jgi:hypothetical protein
MAAPTFKINSDAAAAPSDLTAAQLTAKLEPFVANGVSEGEGTQGLAFRPASGLTGDITTGPGSGFRRLH